MQASTPKRISVSGSGGVMVWAVIIHNSIVCIDIMYMKFHNTRFKIVRNNAFAYNSWMQCNV